MQSMLARTIAYEPQHVSEDAVAEGLDDRTERRHGAAFRCARVLLIPMLLAAPLAFGAVESWAWISMCILAALLLVLWAIGSFRGPSVRIVFSPLYFPAIALLLLGLLQLASHRTMDAQGTREALLALAGNLIVFFAAIQLWSLPRTVFTHRFAVSAVTKLRDGQGVGLARISHVDERKGGVSTPPLACAPESLQDSLAERSVKDEPLSEANIISRKRSSSAGFKPRPSGGIWRTLGAVISIYSFSLALFAILQFFSSTGLIYWRVKTDGWIFGPYVNHNHYAGLMELLIPVSVMFALSPRKDRRVTTLFGLAALLPIVSVLLSGSRAGCIAVLAELVAIAAVMAWHTSPRERRRYAATGLAAITLLAALFLWLATGKVASRLASIGGVAHSPQVTLGNRLRLAGDTLRIFRDHLWLGTGVGSFAVVYPEYQSFATNLSYHHAHNDYAEALAETGIVGGLLIAFALVIFFSSAFRDLRARLRHGAGWIQLGAAIGCCGILVHSFADFNLHIPANAAWFAFLLGISQARGGAGNG